MATFVDVGEVSTVNVLPADVGYTRRSHRVQKAAKSSNAAASVGNSDDTMSSDGGDSDFTPLESGAGTHIQNERSHSEHQENLKFSLEDCPIVQEEEDEKKSKLALGLMYQGFSISGLCLCIVIEPRVDSSLFQSQGDGKISSERITTRTDISKEANTVLSVIRGATPLFLPEYEDDRDTTFNSHQVESTATNPLGSGANPHLFESGGILQLSQLIQISGCGDGGGDIDNDRDVFMADAEEGCLNFS